MGSGHSQAATGLCGCFSVAYYQPFFNVDTSDVKVRAMRMGMYFSSFCLYIASMCSHCNACPRAPQDRLLATFAFWRAEPTFLNLIGDTPDLYGPFWVSKIVELDYFLASCHWRSASIRVVKLTRFHIPTFQLATTLIFCISATSNLARTLIDGYNYDFEVRS